MGLTRRPGRNCDRALPPSSDRKNLSFAYRPYHIMPIQTSSNVPYTQSGKDSQLTDAELKEKYKAIIHETTLYYRLRHLTKACDWLFHTLENLVYARAIKAPLQAPIFPLGNFRSGTSFLEKVITDHPTIGSFVYASQIFPRSPLVTKFAMSLAPSLNARMLPIHMPNSVDTLSPYEGEPIWRHCKNNCWTDHATNVLGRIVL